jgi:dTDP-glucose 4,6-dehydratase
VLVTGGAGFIPSHFVRHLLLHTGHEVVSLDAITYAGNLENLADVLSHPRLSFVQGDIRDERAVRRIVPEVDVVVHAAANSHVEQSIREGARAFVSTNVEGTRILLDAARDAELDLFVLISSCEVYGSGAEEPIAEDALLEPRSPYSATKAAADRLGYAYHVTYGMPVTIVRPFTNYGPFQHPEKMIPRFVTQALRDDPLTIHGPGTASRDWVYVDDHAEAIARVIEAGDAVAGEALNVATGKGRSVVEIAELVLDLLGKPRSLKVHTDDRPGQVTRNVGSPEKAAALLGWRARTSFEDGLARTVSWYRDNEAWWRAALSQPGVSSSSAPAPRS